MKVHEYQAKSILSGYGVPVPEGRVARSPEEARDIAEEIGGACAVKAQVHAGGRGKAGGILLVSSAGEAGEAAESLLGTRLATAQTGPEGVPVSAILVEEALALDRELYVGIVVDGAAKGPIVMASEAGGMEIEEVAESAPEKLLRAEVDPLMGMQAYQARALAYRLNLPPEQVRPMAGLLLNVYKTFEENDCSLVEINPLALTDDGRLLAADAKLSLDDDALFRHPDAQEMHDPGQEDALEAEAGQSGISYVKLQGNVGCMVNGAGLAMATMDATTAAGAAPANFLDVGGGADEEKVAQALKIILSDPNVNAVLINIFGGILRCDIVARGMLMAAEAAPHAIKPMVVRMQGTNAEQGRTLLSESSLDVNIVDDLNQAAQAVRAMS